MDKNQDWLADQESHLFLGHVKLLEKLCSVLGGHVMTHELWRIEHQMLTRCLLQLGTELQNSRCNLLLLPTTTRSTDVYARDCIDNYGTCRQYFPMGHQNLAVHVQKVASYHKEMYTTKLVTSIWSFFTLADKNKSSADSFKGFLLKKHAPKSPDFEEIVFF